jgi:hypothetical protein
MLKEVVEYPLDAIYPRRKKFRNFGYSSGPIGMLRDLASPKSRVKKSATIRCRQNSNDRARRSSEWTIARFLVGSVVSTGAKSVVGIMAGSRHWVKYQAESFGRHDFANRSDQMTVRRELSPWVQSLKLGGGFVDSSNGFREDSLRHWSPVVMGLPRGLLRPG